MCVNCLVCDRVKGGEGECFWIYSGVKQGCIVSPVSCIFNVYIDGVIKVKMGVRFIEETREGRFLTSCMQMTWIYVTSWMKTEGQWWDILLRCV